MSRPTGGIGKRPAEFVPQGEPRNVLMSLSKAALAELVWDFASISHGEEDEVLADPTLALRIIAQHHGAVCGSTGATPNRVLRPYVEVAE